MGEVQRFDSLGSRPDSSDMALQDGNNLFVTAGSNAAGQLVVSTINPTWLPVSVNLSYDANGNLLGDGQKNYAYDDFNQLSSVWVAGQWKTDFVYDGLGRRRIARDYGWNGGWQQTNETRYVCDGLLPIQELDGNNVVKVSYTRGLDLSGTFGGAGGIGGLLARTDSSGSAFYHADLGGNITSLTDSGGNVVARYLYDPFGGLLGKWGSLADANRYRFSSKELHPASGMYYYGYRFFDSNLQRWINRDPIGERGGVNLYGFVFNQPLGELDAYGLLPPDVMVDAAVARSGSPAAVQSYQQTQAALGVGIMQWVSCKCQAFQMTLL